MSRSATTSLFLLSSLAGMLAVLPAQAQPPASTTPITGPSVPSTPVPTGPTLSTEFLPIFVDNNDVLGAQTTAGTANQSVGFFFDTKSDNNIVNALGFSAQSNVSWTNTYKVSLWSYDPTGISLLAEETFSPGDPNLFASDDNGDSFIDNYWIKLTTPITLARSDSAVDPNGEFGYAVAASGDWNQPIGNFQEQGGTITFNPNIEYDGNGYNEAGFPEYAFPSFLAYNTPNDPASGDVYGYWNPNISLVPGPLPVMGGAVAFGWTRRLRRRIRSASDR